ncbi:hypothetical protein Agub_g424 [Astrephomene gubernaculifera]|uniref:RCC1-like domain-containing protein n=1 Tax=Astrephomene gubernaculifera TaxID=47775 RepID=A0AAD3DFR4_9CHLO|nr:hypothetical protein Agub_g424 [Astrephomene gubernaculifera]
MSKALHRVLVTFGTAADGRLGLGFPLASQLIPRIVPTLAGYSVKQVSCGGAHTAVVTDDGTLFTFGINEWGQLGHSNRDKFVAAPIEVGLPDPVKAVAAGGHHTLALTTAGEVWSWGMAGEGQLGLGQPQEMRQVEPRLIKTLQGAGVVALAAGDHHSLALTSCGQVFSWGRGEHGALGHGTVHGYVGVELTPKRIRALPDPVTHGSQPRITSITAGPFNSGAVDSSGAAYVWGHGNGYQLGTGRAEHELQPRRLSTLPGGVRSLSLGQNHSLAVVGDGCLVAFGTDDSGSLGAGAASLQQRAARQPIRVAGLPLARAAAAGWRHSLALSEDGRIFAWGWSGAAGMGVYADYGGGQLGLGDDEDRWVPEQLMRIHTSKHRFYDLRMSYLKPWRALQVAAGRNHSAAVVETELDVRDLVDG